MNHLLRPLAPISDGGWALLDEEARARLAPALGARRLVDFSGPLGWQHSATNTGRTRPLDGAPDGVAVQQRRVLALIETRADFELSRAELADGDRGADDVDLGPLDDAVHRIAVAENTAVLDGWGKAAAGVRERSPHAAVALGDGFAAATAAAVATLLEAGVAGPYGLALGTEPYRKTLRGTEDGYPLASHLREILDGPIVWVPGIDGGAVVSLRGGDFVLECGQDLSIGYSSHDDRVVRLYVEESFSFHVATPEAGVALTA